MLLVPKTLNRQPTYIGESYISLLGELQRNIIPLLYVVSNQYVISDIFIDVYKNLAYLEQHLKQVLAIAESYDETTITYQNFSWILSLAEGIVLRYRMIACFKHNNHYVFDSENNIANKIGLIDEIYEKCTDALQDLVQKAIIVDIPTSTSPRELVNLINRCIKKK